MATTVPLDKVRDREYTNWLKVTLALYYMKSGLHTFIQSEVNCLHQSLVQKIYGGQTVPLPPCTMCHASLVKRNTYTGTWEFLKQCRSYCHAWLYELLVLHTNPKSEKIYWDNTDVASWPFSPWQCAKVFMPRGQLPSSTGPAECDAQALLTLLRNCRYFHHKLSPSGQSLTHSISLIRNKVIHDGEMKVSDTDRKDFIQQIIQLLEDPVSLNSRGDCKAAVGNIHKIDNDPVDVFFNMGLEITALREAVNEVRQELGKQEKEIAYTVHALKEEYEQLREQVTKRFEDVEKELLLHEKRMVTIERDVESVQEITNTVLKQQEKLQNVHTTVTSEQTKRFENLETSIVLIEKNVDLVKEKTDTALQHQEKRLEEIKATVTKLSESLPAKEATQTVRVLAVRKKVSKLHIGQRTKKNKSCRKGNILSETLTKRRPETDGLRRLKSQTEDKLDTVRRLGYIPTTLAEKARKLLEEKRSVVIKGNPGEGKTTTALQLIDNEIFIDRRVVVRSPRDWEMVDTNWIDIIVIEDIFGQFDLDSDHLQEWMVYLPTIQEHVDVRKLQVIITTRADILSKAYSKVGSLKFFSGELSLMLSSEKLERSEKMSILNRELRRHARNIKEDEKEKCITNFSGLIGFPQCCSLFAGDINLFGRGSEFFKSPEKYFILNITELEDTRFLSLAFLFCKVNVFEEDLSPETMPESSKCLLTEIASCLQISKKKASITLLRDVYDGFLGLYVVKTTKHKRFSWSSKYQPYIEFSHATVYDAVGHTLGGRCVEMIVKHGTPEYLYQRTYTAAVEDITTPNVFLPVSVYSLLAERMVCDFMQNKSVNNVVKHSALKQYLFVVKLKELLHTNQEGIKEFLMTDRYMVSSNKLCSQKFGLSEGNCTTFLQCILQADADTVKLVYNQFLNFLSCTHNNITDCWKCKEKQKLLDLALYYHHFEIADELITMNACYTHVSLCNVAKHDDFKRAQTILESLKMKTTFRSKCQEAKKALCNAYISGTQSIIDCLLMEGITLDGRYVRDVVQQGNMNALLDIVEHLRCHNKWSPHWDADITDRDVHYLDRDMFHFAIYRFPFSKALSLAYQNEKLDMANYLVKNGVKVSIFMLKNVLKYSHKTVATLIQHLKDADSWDPKCDVACEALENVYREQKYSFCDLLIQEGVSLKMDSLPRVMFAFEKSLEKAVQHLKVSGNWDPKCDDASKALEKALCEEKLDVCELLIHDGVSLTMKNLPGVIDDGSLEITEKVIQHLKCTGNWNPKCDDAYTALVYAFSGYFWDLCDPLIQNGISLTMKDLIHYMNSGSYCLFNDKLDMHCTAKEIVQHLKETGNWNPLCEDASKALEKAFMFGRYGLCDLLIHNGVSLTMDNFLCFIDGDIETTKKVIQHLKYIGNWNPKCVDASAAFTNIHCGNGKRYELYDLLITEGVRMPLVTLPYVMTDYQFARKAVNHFKGTGIWDPKCDFASKALESAYSQQKFDVCDLLISEGVSHTTKKLPSVLTLMTVKKAIQHLKDTGNWNPTCDDASESLAKACGVERSDVCELLIREGVSLTMKNLPCIICQISLRIAEKAMQYLKDTGNWNPECCDASALEYAYSQEDYDKCNILIQKGDSLLMKNLPSHISKVSLRIVGKAIQYLKGIGKWDPKCDNASKALENAYSQKYYDLCNLLIREGVSLMMKNLPGIIHNTSTETVKKAIRHLRDTGNWEPRCDDASKALEKCFCQKKFDVCYLLMQNGISLKMKNLPGVTNVCHDIAKESLETVEIAIQNLEDSGNWDPKCDEAAEALINAFCNESHYVCNLLISKNISLTMNNLPNVIDRLRDSCMGMKAIRHLKDTGNWDPKSDEACKALEFAVRMQNYDLLALLIEERVSLTMKNLSDVMDSFTNDKFDSDMMMKTIQNLKDTGNWDPKCDDASKVLEIAFRTQKYKVCDLLIQEGVSLKMKNLHGIVGKFRGSLHAAKKAIQHMENTGSWDPKCDDASEALENVYRLNKYHVHDLLIQEGVLPTVKTLPWWSLESVTKTITNLKDAGTWDPKCNDASKVLIIAYYQENYDTCDLLIQEGVSLTVKTLPWWSLESVTKAIALLKGTGNWDLMSDDASRALENAFQHWKYDVCNLLIQ